MRRLLAAAAVIVAAVVGLTAIGAIVPVLAGTGATTLDTAPVTCMLPGDGTTAAGLNAEQVANANTIIATGKSLHVPDRGQIVAIAVAMQESTLRNLHSGDRDSLGLFQQRAAWGSAADRTDPPKAATMFYTGGHGGQRGLLDVPGWIVMPVWQAAQEVQGSAFPQAYAKWEPLATQLVNGTTCTAAGGPLTGNTAGAKAVEAAARWLGTPYSWGGGSFTGPTLGVAQGAHTIGFDCSGLTLYAWFQAAGLRLPHLTDSQAALTTRVDPKQAQAGDLIFFTEPGQGGYPHMGILDGQGGMIHAPHTGAVVTRVPNVLTDPYWSAHLGMIGRPKTTTKA